MTNISPENKYLQGLGFEIGAHNLPLDGGARYFGDRYKEYAYIDCQHDILCDALELPFPDNSLDYFASSHVIEHLPDTIKALCEWYRVVKPGGCIYTIVPDRRFTFDFPRKMTEQGEFWKDFKNKQTAVSTDHLHDFIYNTKVDVMYPGMSPEEQKKRQDNDYNHYKSTVEQGGEINLHFHVFERSNVIELIKSIKESPLQIKWDLVYDIEQYPKNRSDGYLFVIQKHRVETARTSEKKDTFAFTKPGQDPLKLVCPTTLQSLDLIDAFRERELFETIQREADHVTKLAENISYLLRRDKEKAYPILDGKPSFVREHIIHLNKRVSEVEPETDPRFYYNNSMFQ